ncbi:4-hydroxythreonine-4-phosphate dehydrogenase [Mariprofundus ferrinatatus]|uniref:4-hydroxythreonine-4-phosphate dehydrogenase n=1 Tax=Mariprofundus ferrinatatus TaxID=1921087 RepID=A0A2K8L1N2_9PROT|nr:4-hydroxythreonine-4-phosphate dehydrogenase PdxA [Mariprofundus ferrinatatus]ATX81153.1 4-hydroxythreonine-4-phosphate dehydrogenase [Mariprofundus ferrinatatus]
MPIKPYLITVGEPAGIGPDCIIRAFSTKPETFRDCLIAAPKRWLEERASLLNVSLVIREFASLDDACRAEREGDVLHCWNPLGDIPDGPVTAGTPAAATAGAVIHCIESATLACLQSEASALVTGPIEKAILKSEGFQFPGHTEFLAHLSRSDSSCDRPAVDFVMMLASDQLRVALLTTHMALSDVPRALSTEATLDCIRIVHRDLQQRFAIPEPRLGLCGLNPHAGEQGHFGREEIEILAPAAAQAAAEGINLSGPLPADTLFSAGNRKHFDAIICCYHDQALIPIKALCFGDSVNVTLGLPFIRTSVDHGTALDLVGSENVSSSSLLAAMSMARRMAGNI